MASTRAIPDALDPEETLTIERGWLPKAGLVAIVAGILPLIALVLQTMATSGMSNDVGDVKSVAQSLTVYGAGEQGAGLAGRQVEIATHLGDNAALMIAVAVVSALSLVLIGPVLMGLLRSAWRRRPSFPRWFFWAPVVGGLAFGIGTTVAMAYGALELADFASLPAAERTNAAAIDALNARADDLGGVLIVTVIGQMLVAIGIGSAALSAMNVGLLTKLMGFLGVILAAITVLSFLDQQGLLRAFWFIALGVTLLGKWPSGRPAAWETGKAEPWPTRAQLMEAAERAREAQQSEADVPAPKPKAGSGRKRRK